MNGGMAMTHGRGRCFVRGAGPRRRNASGRRGMIVLPIIALASSTVVLPADARGQIGMEAGLPVRGHISSGYGYRKSPFSGRTEFHRGVDIAARLGTTVVATDPGRVVVAGWKDSACGRAVVLEHESGLKTHFCHLREVRVRVGQSVRHGETIGTVGSTGRSTGPHLHFAISGRDGRFLDPRPYLQTGFKSQVVRKKVHRVSWTGSCNRPVNIPAEYAALLKEATGRNGANWLDYVTGYVDRLDFIPAHELRLNNGRIAIGVASVVRGCRWAQVATLGRPAKDIARTIVHEAAHLKPYRETGRLAKESTAKELGASFSTHLRDAQARKAQQQENEITGRQRLESSRKKVHRVSWTGSCNRPVNIPAEYAALLKEATGRNGANWLDYVTGYVDRIDFIPAHQLRLNNGRSGDGVASVVRGCRWAQVATLGRPAKDIATTIVHAVAHLAPYHKTGRYAQESEAKEFGARFSTHLRDAQARKAQQENKITGRQRLESTVEPLAPDVRKIQENEEKVVESLNRIEARLGRIEARLGKVEGALNSPREFNEGPAPEGQRRVRISGSLKPMVGAEDLRRWGLDYYYGDAGPRRDYRLAAEYLRQAAERGDATAQVYIGGMYLDGYGLQRNDQQAARRFQRAASQGDADGQYLLAFLHYYGKGVRRDYEEAIMWLRRAAEQGHGRALERLEDVVGTRHNF